MVAIACTPAAVGSIVAGGCSWSSASAGDAASPQDWAAASGSPTLAAADQQDNFSVLNAGLAAEDDADAGAACEGGEGAVCGAGGAGAAEVWFEELPAVAESPLSSAALRDSPLGEFLTARAQVPAPSPAPSPAPAQRTLPRAVGAAPAFAARARMRAVASTRTRSGGFRRMGGGPLDALHAFTVVDRGA
jgi:hypothetical protein